MGDTPSFDVLGRLNAYVNRSFPPEQDDEWRLDAACIGMDHLFFIERGASARAAKAICATCPVIEECLEYAMVTHPTNGIWGGLTERELRAVRLRRRRAS